MSVTFPLGTENYQLPPLFWPDIWFGSDLVTLDLARVWCHGPPYRSGLWHICSTRDLCVENTAGYCDVSCGHHATAVLFCGNRQECTFHSFFFQPNRISRGWDPILYLIYDHTKRADKPPGLQWWVCEDFRVPREWLVYIGIHIAKGLKNMKGTGSHSFSEECHHFIALEHSPDAYQFIGTIF